MSITDELREYAQSWRETPNLMDDLDAGDIDGLLGDFEHIADRIDAAHQKAEDEWKAKHGQMWLKGYAECHAELLEGNETLEADLENCGWVRLPKDADGEYIHVGDVLTDDAEFKSEGKVMRLMLEGEGWMVGFGCGGWTEPSIHKWHHHHAPTVEDVLREFADEMNQNLGMYTGEAIDADEWRSADNKTIAEYAAKLRLAGDGE